MSTWNSQKANNLGNFKQFHASYEDALPVEEIEQINKTQFVFQDNGSMDGGSASSESVSEEKGEKEEADQVGKDPTSKKDSDEQISLDSIPSISEMQEDDNQPNKEQVIAQD